MLQKAEVELRLRLRVGTGLLPGRLSFDPEALDGRPEACPPSRNGDRHHARVRLPSPRGAWSLTLFGRGQTPRQARKGCLTPKVSVPDNLNLNLDLNLGPYR